MSLAPPEGKEGTPMATAADVVHAALAFFTQAWSAVSAMPIVADGILILLSLGVAVLVHVVLRGLFRRIEKRIRAASAPRDFHVRSWRIVSGAHLRDALVSTLRYLWIAASGGAVALVAVALARFLIPAAVPVLSVIVRGLWLSLVSFLAWLIAVRLGLDIVTSLLALIESRAGSIRPVAFRSFTILTGPMVRRGILLLLRVLGWTLLAVSLVVLAAVVLGFFRFTWSWSHALLMFVGGIVGPLGGAIVGYIPKLLFAAVIIVIARFVLRLLKSFFVEIGEGRLGLARFDREWASTTYKLLRIVVVIFAFVMVFPYIPGSGSEAFRSVAIFLGVLLSLGSSSFVGNIMAGISLTYMSPYRVGDRVRIGDTEGDVVEKTLLVTRVRTTKNVVVTIPNSVVLSREVDNFTLKPGTIPLILHTSVTIGYNVPWRAVHEALLRAAASVPSVLEEPKPFVLQSALDDFAVRYELNASTDDAAGMVQTYSTLHAAIQDEFAAASIEIMTPAYTAFRDGNESTIPERPSRHRSSARRRDVR